MPRNQRKARKTRARRTGPVLSPHADLIMDDWNNAQIIEELGLPKDCQRLYWVDDDTLEGMLMAKFFSMIYAHEMRGRHERATEAGLSDFLVARGVYCFAQVPQLITSGLAELDARAKIPWHLVMTELVAVVRERRLSSVEAEARRGFLHCLAEIKQTVPLAVHHISPLVPTRVVSVSAHILRSLFLATSARCPPRAHQHLVPCCPSRPQPPPIVHTFLPDNGDQEQPTSTWLVPVGHTRRSRLVQTMELPVGSAPPPGARRFTPEVASHITAPSYRNQPFANWTGKHYLPSPSDGDGGAHCNGPG